MPPPPPSTLRNDTSRAVFLARIAALWDHKPGLTFAELVAGALGDPLVLVDRYGVRYSNDRLLDALAAFAVKAP